MSRPLDTGTVPLPERNAMTRLHGLNFDIGGFSDQGPRSENQDAFTTDTFEASGLVAVADGMGGEKGGRLAADTALRTLIQQTPIDSMDAARRAARAADRVVAAAADEDPTGRTGMGCALGLLSLVATRADGPFWIGAHVGDVRILSRAPDGTVRLETRDHTPAFALWESGEIELDAIPEAQGANRLQRAVGRGGEADALWVPARPGWVMAIVSDGVTKAMRLDELGAALGSASAMDACDAIRRKVLERGADDNFTAVVVRILGEAGPVTVPHATGRHTMHHPAGPPRRSPAVVTIGILSLLALLAAGVAFWMARDAREVAGDRTELMRLRQEVDSLRIRLQELEEPFGPAPGAPPPSP
jgi:serine/threonine protein phosphatase Stp1